MAPSPDSCLLDRGDGVRLWARAQHAARPLAPLRQAAIGIVLSSGGLARLLRPEAMVCALLRRRLGLEPRRAAVRAALLAVAIAGLAGRSGRARAAGGSLAAASAAPRTAAYRPRFDGAR